MNPVKFKGSTIIGKPKGWDDARDGECVGLPAQISLVEGGMRLFTSIWKPTDQERRDIAEGHNVAISCFSVQVPIMLSTTDVDGPIVPFGADESASESA